MLESVSINLSERPQALDDSSDLTSCDNFPLLRHCKSLQSSEDVDIRGPLQITHVLARFQKF
jgi:hypothetical protein